MVRQRNSEGVETSEPSSEIALRDSDSPVLVVNLHLVGVEEQGEQMTRSAVWVDDRLIDMKDRVPHASESSALGLGWQIREL